MSMNLDEVLQPFARFLEDICPLAAVRAIQSGGDHREMWGAFVQSGFLDAFVSDDCGGAGLDLAQAWPLIALLGRHAVPLPVADTMLARALLGAAHVPAPDGSIVIATGSAPAPFAGLAEHVLSGSAEHPVVTGGTIYGTGIPFDMGGYVSGVDSKALRPIAAIIRAMLIAGAAEHLLERTTAYANERMQFGKPVGRQQAVQQQLAVMAEHTVAARMAAALGARTGIVPHPANAAIAKYRTSQAAAEISSIAHAVHGAIGISEEYDLHILTRALHSWRLADGSESYWSKKLAGVVYNTPPIDFIRQL